MPYKVSNMSVDITSSNVSVGVSKQAEPGRENDWVNIGINFHVLPDAQQTEGTMEQRYRKCVKEILLEAGNSL